MDITTTEVADHVVGGVMACDSSRFDIIIEKGIPLVLSVGALDMVNFGSKNTIPSHLQTRKIHVHNEQVRNQSKKCFFPLLNGGYHVKFPLIIAYVSVFGRFLSSEQQQKRIKNLQSLLRIN